MPRIENSIVGLDLPVTFTVLDQGGSILQAGLTPWNDANGFRPVVNVTSQPATVDRMTLEQHGSRAISELMALGMQIVSYDLWPHGALDGRRIVSAYVVNGQLIEQHQFAALSGGRIVLLTAAAPAVAHESLSALFTSCVASLSVERLPEPIGAANPLPALDAYARARGERVLDLASIGPAQRLAPGEGPLTPRDADRIATAHQKAARSVGVDATYGAVAHTVRVYLEGEDAVRLGTPSPLDRHGASEPLVNAPFVTETAPVAAAPIMLHRWLGLGPAWTFALEDGDGEAAAVESETLTRRLGDPSAPVQAGASMRLRALWEQEWLLWTVNVDDTTYAEQFVSTRSFGTIRLSAPEQGLIRLSPVPSLTLWRVLVRAAGTAA